jgi:predicted transcriptional regulator
MIKNKLNRTELKIFRLLLHNKPTITNIASKLNLSLSWTSECIDHLEDLGFIDVEKRGISKYVFISSKPPGEKLSLLMNENDNLDLNKILIGLKLKILPLLLRPGSNIKEISKKTSLSKETINNSLKLWKSMGIARFDKQTKMYSINSRQIYLIQFVIKYSEFINQEFLKEHLPNAIMIWQWRDEFLFSYPSHIKKSQFIEAALTRLDNSGYELLHVSQYYFYSPGLKNVSKEEAFVQSIKIDPNNPRILKLLRNAFDKKEVNRKQISKYARKYGLITKLEKEVYNIAR